MNFDSMNQYLKSLAKGITLIQLNMEDLRTVEFFVPPVDLQDIFIQIKQQIDKSKLVIQKALDEAQLLFDSLMQQYFG